MNIKSISELKNEIIFKSKEDNFISYYKEYHQLKSKQDKLQYINSVKELHNSAELNIPAYLKDAIENMNDYEIQMILNKNNQKIHKYEYSFSMARQILLRQIERIGVNDGKD